MHQLLSSLSQNAFLVFAVALQNHSEEFLPPFRSNWVESEEIDKIVWKPFLFP